jgi:hypothetical protein
MTPFYNPISQKTKRRLKMLKSADLEYLYGIYSTFSIKSTGMKKYLLFFLVYTLALQSFSQDKWKPFVGLNASASSDLYYVGPSFSAGVIHSIGKKGRWGWAPEIQYFKKHNEYASNGPISEWDKFESFSIRSNFNYKFGNKSGKGFIIGGGIGFQRAKDECVTVTQNGNVKEENVHFDAIRFGAFMLTFNTGYSFPLKKNRSIQTIVSIIGPQTAKDYLGTYVEAISVMNAGIRLVL